MSIERRLQALESKTTGNTRYFVARPHDDSEHLIHVQESGQAAYQVMTEDEYQQWLAEQPYHVVYRLVYPDSASNE